MSAKKIGKIHSAKAMFFREGVGTAESQGCKYEMAISVPSRSPIIHSKQSGKYWTIAWNDLIELAVAAGIDKGGS